MSNVELYHWHMALRGASTSAIWSGCDHITATTSLRRHAVLRGTVFVRQPRDQRRGRLHRLDRPDALAAAPDVLPCLGGSAAEVHRARVTLGQLVGVQARGADRALEV